MSKRVLPPKKVGRREKLEKTQSEDRRALDAALKRLEGKNDWHWNKGKIK